MEDAYATVPFLLEVPVADGGCTTEKVPPRVADQLRSAALPKEPLGDLAACASLTNTIQVSSEHFREPLHFFGVFDGHGGSEAALHCASTLHQRIVEALSSSGREPPSPTAAQQQAAASTREAGGSSAPVPAAAAAAPASSGGDVEMLSPPGRPSPLASRGGAAGPAGAGDRGFKPDCTDSFSSQEGAMLFDARFIEQAMTEAFCKTDQEFGESDNAALVGTTAVVALVGSRQLYVANCGTCTLPPSDAIPRASCRRQAAPPPS